MTALLTRWLTPAAGIFFVLSLTFWSGHHRATLAAEAAASQVKAQRQAEDDRRAVAALHAALQASATTAGITAGFQENTHALQPQVDRLETDLAATRAAADRLRAREQDAIAAASGSCRVDVPADPTAAAGRDAARAALILLADVHSQLANRAIELGTESDKRGAAGLKCQRDYATVRSGVNEHTSKRGIAPDDGMPMDMQGDEQH